MYASVKQLEFCDAAPHATRSLRVGLINLMPDKIRSLAQFARLLVNDLGERPLALVPCVPESYRPRDGRGLSGHRSWRQVKEEPLDGLIVTGAPFDRIAYEEVAYWEDLVRLFDWSDANLQSTLFLCWGAMAALRHFCGVERRQVSPKLSGIYQQEVMAPSPLLQGLGGGYRTPVSRHATIDLLALRDRGDGLQLLAGSAETGVSLAQRGLGRQVFLLDHLEYDALALRDEYLRDRALEPAVALPRGYFPADDPTALPQACWQPAARRLFVNWVTQLRAGKERRLAGY